MKIAIGCDHAGLEFKNKVKEILSSWGHEVTDFGTNSKDSVDYPDFGLKVAMAVANGEVDRSATGSGVSARVALHYSRGELARGEKITIESILGTTMDAEIKEITNFGPHKAVIPEVSGTAYFTGKNEFWFDHDDPLKNGFIIR